MPKIKVYNQDGKDVGELELSDKLFAVPWNPDLVHQVVSAERANLRTPIAHTKDRAEVRGGGKKPWRQKGTGRARRSEEHTSELHSQSNLVCRLLLEKKTIRTQSI